MLHFRSLVSGQNVHNTSELLSLVVLVSNSCLLDFLNAFIDLLPSQETLKVSLDSLCRSLHTASLEELLYFTDSYSLLESDPQFVASEGTDDFAHFQVLHIVKQLMC